MFGTRVVSILSLLLLAIPASAQTVPAGVDETLYSFHTVKRVRTDYTAAQGCPGLALPKPGTYPLVVQDVGDLYSFRTRASDGKVVQTVTNAIGTLRQCFGVVVPPPAGFDVRVQMVSEYQFGGMTLIARGYCDGRRNIPIATTDPSKPTAGSTLYTCWAELTGDGLVTPVGGHLVGTSEAQPDATPVVFDPDKWGLYESTFVNVRVWRPLGSGHP